MYRFFYVLELDELEVDELDELTLELLELEDELLNPTEINNLLSALTFILFVSSMYLSPIILYNEVSYHH